MKKSRQKEYNDFLKTIPEPISKREEITIKREQDRSVVKKNHFTTDTETDSQSRSPHVVRRIKKTDLPIVLNINMSDKGIQMAKVGNLKQTV